MTDNEIIKALEHCLSNDDCDGCASLNSNSACVANNLQIILALINRQKETIEQLQTALFKCGEDAVEIENYKKIAEYQQGVSMDRFFEIKRLKEEIEEYQKHIDNDIIYVKAVKAEAVKEFAERLKAECGNIARMDFGGYIYFGVGYGLIDDLVKEFTEGENT